MTRMATGLAIAAMLLLAPTAKADNDWYFQGLVGKRFLTDADLTLDGTTSPVTISVDAVPSGSAAVGYRFRSFPYRSLDARVEIQGGASESEPDTISPRGELATRAGSTATRDGFDADNLHSIYGMVNLWLDYPIGDSWVVTAGGGLGAAYIDWDNAGCCGLGVILDASDVVFAYQVGASFGYEVVSNLVVGLDYRYFATEDPTFTYNGDWSSEYGAHDLMFAFRYFAF
jgi:opacity protein-like surface antigen